VQASFADVEPAEPPSATGQYPGPVWANGNGRSTASAYSAENGDTPEPPSATGQYPAPVWSNGGVAAAGYARAASGEEEVPEPPSATGQYPAPVWAAAQAHSLPSRRTSSLGAAGETPENLSRSLKEADYSEELGGAIEPQPTTTESGVELTNEAIYRIVREVAEADSGDAVYSAVSADREFETPGHPAHQVRHFGLGFGLVLVTQESGRLGRVLSLTKQRDPQALAENLGPNAEAVLAVTNASTPEQRLQPVGGEPLWSAAWIERFRRLGAAPACQYAQNEEAIDGLFRPMLKIAAGLGITSDRGLAMMFDRVVTCGLGGGLRWIVKAAGPLRTGVQQNHALNMLGYSSTRHFQEMWPELPQDGLLGPETYAALVDLLRQHMAATLPSPAEYVTRIVAAAAGTARRRLLRLRDSPVLTDTIFKLT
jgi:hypothetical protein